MRTSPITRNEGRDRQHVLRLQDPDNPWHLQWVCKRFFTICTKIWTHFQYHPHEKQNCAKIICHLPCVRLDYYANSLNFVHHLRFLAHRKICAQISYRNWYRPNNHPISILVAFVVAVADAIALSMFVNEWVIDADGSNRIHKPIYFHGHKMRLLYALLQHLQSHMWMLPPVNL